MIVVEMIRKAIISLFSAFKKFFMPDRKDLLLSIIISIPMYLLFGLSLIFLLPIIVVGVFIVYTVRRLWKILALYWTVKILHKKTRGDFRKIKNMLGDSDEKGKD